MLDTRRYNLAPAIGFGLVITGGTAWLAGARIDAGASYPLKAVVAFGVMTGAVAAVAGKEHPYPRFGPANGVTMIRAMLVALVAGLIGHPATPDILWWVIGLTAIMAALDGLDGWLARRTRMASGFGARFDMETDAALILVLSILVWQHEKAGAWVLLCGLMRYGFIAAGWLLPWLAQPLQPTLRGKTVAVGQVLGLSVALAPIVPAPLSAIAAALALTALGWSFAIDIMRLSRQ